MMTNEPAQRAAQAPTVRPLMPRIRSTTIRTALLLLVGTAACSPHASSERVPESDVGVVAPPSQAAPTPAVATLTAAEQDSLLQATFAVGEGLGRTRAAVIARLGQPSRTTRRSIDNPHVIGQTDTLVSVIYEQLWITFWVSDAEVANEVRFDIEILKPWPMEVHVPPTANRAHLVQLWGKPGFVRILADTVILNWNVRAYDAEEHLQAYLVHDVIRKLRWSFYID